MVNMGAMATTIVAATCIGLVVGVLAGLLGIGGGSVLLPVFRLVFGLSAVGSTATSLFTIIPTSISGAASHIRNKTCVPKLGIAMGVGGALTSPIGVQLAQASPSWAVMAAAALVICYSAITMLRKAFAAPRHTRVPETTGGASGAVEADEPANPTENALPPAPRLSRRDLVKGALIGALAGVASGYVGLGGGFLMVPLMMALLDMPMKLTSGTSLIAIMILATPATIVQCFLGNVDYLVGIAVVCGSVPGAFVGARLTKTLPERTLRFAFAVMLFVGAALLIVKEAGLIG